MNTEAQRIAIAETCGWKQTHIMQMGLKGKYVRTYQKGLGNLHQSLPDYLNDLNAMHEVEKTLNATLLNSYRRFLYLVVLDDQANTSNEPAWATAAQRAEAFLRATGKWVES